MNWGELIAQGIIAVVTLAGATGITKLQGPAPVGGARLRRR